MGTALTERPTAALVTKDQIDLVKRTVANGATDAELKLYLYDCERQGVHPLDRLLHFTKRGGKYTPVTSIDLMRIRAAETGEYAGNDDAIFTGKPGEPDFAATVAVTRAVSLAGSGKFTATARWSEYYPGDAAGSMWRKMPHTMLAKCAEALALRKGFPRQLAGLYAKEEMDQADRVSSPAAQPDPPPAFVDTTTGELVPPEQRPEPPLDFHYLDADDFKAENGWYHVFRVINGTRVDYKTKKEQVGQLLQQAYQDGLPVKLTVNKSPWIDAVEVWKPTTPDMASGPALTDDDIPF